MTHHTDLACGVRSGSLAKGCCQVRTKKSQAGGGSRQWATEGGGSGIKIKKKKKPFEGKMAESQSILSMAAEKEPQKAGRAPSSMKK